MDDNIEERLNDEGYFMNRDSEQGYRILQQLGIPPTMETNGMGVGEYDSNFYYNEALGYSKSIKRLDENLLIPDLSSL